jgi:hypothetical protein
LEIIWNAKPNDRIFPSSWAILQGGWIWRKGAEFVGNPIARVLSAKFSPLQNLSPMANA